MLSSLLAVVLAVQDQGHVRLPATGSYWDYVHAGDPAGDEYLRVWGADGLAAPIGGPDDSFSFGFLRFDLSNLSLDKLSRATLVVRNIVSDGITSTDAKATPLQVRTLIGDTSKGLDRSDLPGPDSTILATSEWVKGSNPPQLNLDLASHWDQFLTLLTEAKATSSHALYLSLSSAIDPSQGEGHVYKLYSATAQDQTLRPYLDFEYNR